MFTAVRGVLYASGFVFLWAWLAISIRQYDASLPFSIPRWLAPFGFIFVIAGAFLTAMCIAKFATTGRGTPFPLDPPVEFVAVGPYRYVRNPMYLGAISVIAGAGLVAMSPAIILLSIFFWVIAHIFVLLYEEPALENRFGATYLNYKSAVSRWFPRLP